MLVEASEQLVVPRLRSSAFWKKNTWLKNRNPYLGKQVHKGGGGVVCFSVVFFHSKVVVSCSLLFMSAANFLWKKLACIVEEVFFVTAREHVERSSEQVVARDYRPSPPPPPRCTRSLVFIAQRVKHCLDLLVDFRLGFAGLRYPAVPMASGKTQEEKS